MGAGAFIEPLVVITLLLGGAFLTRNTTYTLFPRSQTPLSSAEKGLLSRNGSLDSIDADMAELGLLSETSISSRLLPAPEPTWRKRTVGVLCWKTQVTSLNTRVFREYFLSRVLIKFPFLVEAWYWALVYWVYQLSRAFTAVTMASSTVNIARTHALQVIALEQRLHIFHEVDIQAFFLQHATLLLWINRIYSFIHIPGTIAFLAWLFYYTSAPTHADQNDHWEDVHAHAHVRTKEDNGDVAPRDPNTNRAAGPKLYEARRRTLATCNLLAFCVFTLWPCMPPRLLSDPSISGPVGERARRFGFVDTVHGVGGESSVWTQNRFCNQYAAMPSLHFGYALLIGITIATLPLSPSSTPTKSASPSHSRARSHSISLPFSKRRIHLPSLSTPSLHRLLCITLGFLYAATILVAILATANHFILDAVAGAAVCAIGWLGNGVLLNLRPVEDYAMWCVRIHVGDRGEKRDGGEGSDECGLVKDGRMGEEARKGMI